MKRRDGSLDFRYPNRTIEQRMELKGEAKDLTAMLQKVLIEQESIKARKKAGTYEEED